MMKFGGDTCRGCVICGNLVCDCGGDIFGHRLVLGRPTVTSAVAITFSVMRMIVMDFVSACAFLIAQPTFYSLSF